MRVFLILLLSINVLVSSPEISKKAERELEKFFDSENLSFTEINELTNSNDQFFKVIGDKNELGILVLTSAKGRYEKFDYMIIYNLDLSIGLIKVLIYRSEYGSEITAKRWLSQFYEKQEDSLKYGSDIQAISGATFSASSLTKNINRINKILRDHKKD